MKTFPLFWKQLLLSNGLTTSWYGVTSVLSPVAKEGRRLITLSRNPFLNQKVNMPIVRPPRDLSKVKSVKKYKTRNGEVVHELVVLFDYVRQLTEEGHIFLCLISSERGRPQ